LKANLLDYSIKAVTQGKDALGEVTVKVAIAKETVIGRGASTDIIEASAKPISTRLINTWPNKI